MMKVATSNLHKDICLYQDLCVWFSTAVSWISKIPKQGGNSVFEPVQSASVLSMVFLTCKNSR